MKNKTELEPLKYAFGSSLKRFDISGINPSLDPSKICNETVGPGTYEPHKCECRDKKKLPEIEPWKRKKYMEEFSKFRGFRNIHLIKQEKLLKRLRGPGQYSVSDDIFKQKSNLVVSDVGFGTSKRFKEIPFTENPAPGSHAILKAENLSRIGKSKQPTFERDGFSDRFKSTEPHGRLAPTRYNPKDFGSFDELIKRKVSHLKTMYECFTGPRDGSTIKNYFAPSSFVKPDKYYKTSSFVEEIFKKPNYGKFATGQRFVKKPSLRILLNSLSNCYRDPDEPGPADYDRSEYLSILPKIVKHDHDVLDFPPPHAFGFTIGKNRYAQKWSIQPGPGRYSVKPLPCMNKKTMHNGNWVFKSKTPRCFYTQPDKYTLM